MREHDRPLPPCRSDRHSQPLEKTGRDCEYFTIMRHPIDRLVSAFFYCPGDRDPQSRPDKVRTRTCDTYRRARSCRSSYVDSSGRNFASSAENRFFVIDPLQWCGYAEHPAPIRERLLEFAKHDWRNKALHQMSFGLYCPPDSFCIQAKVNLVGVPYLYGPSRKQTQRE